MGGLQFGHPYLLGVIGAAGGPPAQPHDRRVVEHVRGPSSPVWSRIQGPGGVTPEKTEHGDQGRSLRQNRRRAHVLAYRDSEKERGSLVVFLTLTWLPIISLFGVILWLRVA